VKLVWRRLKPGDQDYELVFGALFFPLLLLTAFSLSRLSAGTLPICRFQAAYGIPCPTCGVFRATTDFLSGHWSSALVRHPPAFLVLAGGSVFSLYSFAVIFFRGPRLRIVSPPSWLKPAVAGGVLVLLLLNWLYLLSR